MNNLTDWLSEQLSPAMYLYIDQILPEFDFKKIGRG